MTRTKKILSTTLLMIVAVIICMAIWYGIYMTKDKTLDSDDTGWQKVSLEYVARIRGWSSEEYYVELNRQEGEYLVVWVVYKKDVIDGIPGAGESFELFIDRSTNEVVRELHFQ